MTPLNAASLINSMLCQNFFFLEMRLKKESFKIKGGWKEVDEFTRDKLLFPWIYELCIPHLLSRSEK